MKTLLILALSQNQTFPISNLPNCSGLEEINPTKYVHRCRLHKIRSWARRPNGNYDCHYQLGRQESPDRRRQLVWHTLLVHFSKVRCLTYARKTLSWTLDRFYRGASPHPWCSRSSNHLWKRRVIKNVTRVVCSHWHWHLLQRFDL